MTNFDEEKKSREKNVQKNLLPDRHPLCFFFSLLFVFYRWNNTIFEHIAKNVLTSFHIRIYQRIYSTAKKNCYLKNEYKKKKTNAGYIWAA